MKLHNILLTAALFLTAGVVIADNPHGTPPGQAKKEEGGLPPGQAKKEEGGLPPGQAKKEEATTSSVKDFFSLEKEEGMKSMYVTVFRMNNGWKYDVNGFSLAEAEGEGAENSEKVKTFTANLGKGDANAITKSGKKAREYAASLTDVPEDIKAALEGHAIGIYQFEILIPEDVVEISLSGGKGKGNFTELIYDKEAPNGNEFFALEGDANDGILYFGKSNWINSYNNGAIFLISGKKMDSMGAPLPTPVVTLLIALGFGAAFVMYRNRKQVKA